MTANCLRAAATYMRIQPRNVCTLRYLSCDAPRGTPAGLLQAPLRAG